MKIAIFDIGTNSIHMKIVQLYPDLSFEVLDHEKDMTRIGDGSFKAKKLPKGAIKRALKTLDHFSHIARHEGVRRTIAVATSAVRDAKNAAQFVKAVYKKTGIRVRVISGREEGRLIFLGASSGLVPAKEKRMVIDIGGGSAEFVLGDNRRIEMDESLPLGVARLKDRFLKKNPPSKDNLRHLQESIEEKLADVLKMTEKKKFSLVGTGGTLINLASMVYESRESRSLRLRGYYELKRKDLLKLHRRLIHMSTKRIRKIPGLDKKRADLIIAGSVLVTTLLKELKKDHILISDKGIREGVILDFIVKKSLKSHRHKPALRVQWFGQKPFFSGKIMPRRSF